MIYYALTAVESAQQTVCCSRVQESLAASQQAVWMSCGEWFTEQQQTDHTNRCSHNVLTDAAALSSPETRNLLLYAPSAAMVCGEQSTATLQLVIRLLFHIALV